MADAPQDSTLPPNKSPNVSGVVTIEAPPFKAGTENTDHARLNLDAPSLKDTDQAWNLCKATESANKFRSERATAIELEYSLQPPFSASDKIEKAAGWQSNVSTGIMMGIVDPKVLRFVKAITDEVFLTHSSLPVTWPDYRRKSSAMCNHTTKMIQGWKDYSTFINVLAKEDVLHGYAFAVFLDTETWKPRFFKQENAFVPDEARQNAEDHQFFVIKHDFLLHEFIDLFKDEDAAKAVGYDLNNCAVAANESDVKNPREDMTTTNVRKFADYVEDGMMGMTYASSGPRVVKTYLLFSREYDGQISFWIIERDDGKRLRFSSKLFKDFTEVTKLFSFQPGNGSLHPSKGIGRMLIGLTKTGEKMRNRGIDNTLTGSLVIAQADTKDRNILQPTVMAPFCFIPKSVQIADKQFPSSSAAFDAKDQQLSEWLQQSGGAYITSARAPDEKTKTATEASQDFEKANENEDITEARWLDQFFGLVQIMQARAFSDDNIDEAEKLMKKLVAGEQETEDFYDDTIGDKDAIRTIIQIFKELVTPDELKHWRRAPASGFADTDAKVTSQGILAIKKTMTGNPNVDQVKMDNMVVESLGGPDVAKELNIPTPDQTVQAEASRMQMSESVTMSQLLMPVPVSPRDNHMIHGVVCVNILKGVGQKLSDPQTHEIEMKHAELNLNHLGEHLAAYLKNGGLTQNPQFKEINDFYTTMKSQLQQAVIIRAHAEAAMGAASPDHAHAIMDAGAQSKPPPLPSGTGATPGRPSTGAPTASPESFPESGADLDFKAGQTKGVAPVLPAV